MSWITKDELKSRWVLTDNKLRPTVETAELYNEWLANRAGNDEVISFSFSNPETNRIGILSSRLEFAEGPFAEIPKRSNSKQRVKRTTLSEEDDPSTFGIIRNFLYMKSIPLPEIRQLEGLETYDVQSVVKIICAAHRWQLSPLFLGFARFVEINNILKTSEDVVIAAQFVELVGIPKDILTYFWTQVGVHYFSIMTTNPFVSFDELVKEEKASSPDKISRKFQDEIAKPEKFPDLWSLALSQGMVRSLIHTIVVVILSKNYPSFKKSAEHRKFEWLVLGYLEPRISDDSEIMEVISQLRWPADYWKEFLQDPRILCEYSSRAISLVARTLISPRIPRDEFRGSLEINLHIKTTLYMRRNFLFPVCQMSLNEYGRSRNSMNVNFDKAIFFTVILNHIPSGLAVQVNWKMQNFKAPMNYLQPRLIVSMIDDKCSCLQRKSLDRTQPGNMLIAPTFIELKFDGSKELFLSEEAIDENVKNHGVNCRVTLSVVAENREHHSDDQTE